MFIKNIAKTLEGLIYILLGVVAATIIIIFFISTPPNTLVKEVGEIIEIAIFTIFVLLLVPTILSRYANSQSGNVLKRALSKVVYVLKHTHIALGILFIGLRILHISGNLLFVSTEWNMEIITSILLSVLLIPTVIYAILRINNSKKYRNPHRLFLALTCMTFIVHLFY